MRVSCTINRRARTAALCDSGNLVANAISADFARRIGLRREDFVPVPGANSVGTAKKGEKLTIVGQTRRPLSVRLGNHPTEVKFRPIILTGLCTEMILSGPWMQKMRIDQIHSKKSLRFQGRLVPLLPAHIVGPMSMEDNQPVANVVVEERRSVPSRSELSLRVIVHDENRQ